MDGIEVAFINDEVSPSLETAIAFAEEHDVSTIEMRSVDGRNLAQLPLEDVRAIARRLQAAKLRVACLASPLLKWVPQGRAATFGAADQHGFARDACSDEALFDHVFAVATILDAPFIRVFAYLRYAGFGPDDLADDYAALLARAEAAGRVLVLENEPPSNAGTLDEYLAVLDRWHGPRFGALLDIANVYETAGALHDDSAGRVMPYVRHIHCKDFDAESGARRAVGEGSVPYADVLPALLAERGDWPLTLSVETHVPQDAAGATAASIRCLRSLLHS